VSRAARDRNDAAILALLAERDAVVAEVWAAKDAAGLPRHDPAREAEIFEKVRGEAERLGLDAEAVEAIFRRFVGRRLHR